MKSRTARRIRPDRVAPISSATRSSASVSSGGRLIIIFILCSPSGRGGRPAFFLGVVISQAPSTIRSLSLSLSILNSFAPPARRRGCSFIRGVAGLGEGVPVVPSASEQAGKADGADEKNSQKINHYSLFLSRDGRRVTPSQCPPHERRHRHPSRVGGVSILT